MIVVDASVVIAALTDDGTDGRWAEDLLSQEVAAPHLLPVEVAGVLRRSELHGVLSSAAATMAHDDLGNLRIQLHPYLALAERAWELRATVSSYDAWYVALAEELDTPLATIDGRVTRAPGPRCAFLTPPDSE